MGRFVTGFSCSLFSAYFWHAQCMRHQQMRCANDQLLLLFLRLVAIILRPKRFTFNHILLSNVNLFDRLAFISFSSSFHFLQPQSMLKYGTGASCLCNRILTEPRKKKWRCLLLWQYIYIIFFFPSRFFILSRSNEYFE